MTQRLYYESPDRLSFSARVLGNTKTGGRAAVILDRTAFYPEGGGQPGDRGTIDGVRVIDTTPGENGTILHWVDCEEPGFEPGQTVQAVVDSNVRLDHSQQHSAQHILSQALLSLYGWETVGFHLGTETVTIDLDTDSAAWDKLLAAERLANEVVFRDLPQKTVVETGSRGYHESLRGSGDRLPPGVRPGGRRIVSFGDFDSVPCGGTHVSSTGAIGLIKVLGTEKSRGQVRVHFVAGERARSRFEEFRAVIQELGEVLTTGIGDYVDAVNRLRAENQQLSSEVRTFSDRLVSYRARELAAAPTELPAGVELVCALEEADMRTLQGLATAVVKSGERRVALLGGVSDGSAQFVFCRSDSVPVDVNDVLRRCIAGYGGHGGGHPQRSQGGGVEAPSAQALLDEAVGVVYDLLGGAQS